VQLRMVGGEAAVWAGYALVATVALLAPMLLFMCWAVCARTGVHCCFGRHGGRAGAHKPKEE
jgi:hypothetical protein